MEAGRERPPATGLLVAATLGLFLVWANTFLAFEVLLVPRDSSPALGAAELVIGRCVPVGLIAGAWLLLRRREEAAAIAREHPGRLLAAAILAGPVYHGVLYDGMLHRVEGPVASVVTSLVPLYMLGIGALFLGERLSLRKAAGCAVGFGGIALLATAREGGGARALRVAEVALVPLSWAIYSALTRTVARTRSPLAWTYLVLAAGGVLSLAFVPFADLGQFARLDARGLALLAYLVLLATLAGYAVWSWLLRHLPASTVGMTVFLNPPLTLASKATLAVLFPASFAVTLAGREWAGGALALAGVALAVTSPRPAAER